MKKGKKELVLYFPKKKKLDRSEMSTKLVLLLNDNIARTQKSATPFTTAVHWLVGCQTPMTN